MRVRLGHLSLRLARRRNADHPKAHASGAAPLRGPGRSARNCSTPMSSLKILFVEEEEEESEQERLTYPPGTTPLLEITPPPSLFFPSLVKMAARCLGIWQLLFC